MMSLDAFTGGNKLPDPIAAPRADDQQVSSARRRARARAGSAGRRSTVLGGRSGGGETVARKTLLGE